VKIELASLDRTVVEVNASEKRLNLVVGIATSGRRDALSAGIELLARQTRLPDQLLICPVSPEDLDAACLARFPASSAVISGKIGSSAQRNQVMSAAKDGDVILFLDDDFFACSDYLARLESLFLTYDDVIGVTGRLLADGINGPGLSVAEAMSIISKAEREPVTETGLSETYGTYGCNMAFRLATIRRHAVLFDENLPLYGWQEDIDFSRRLAPFGRIVRSEQLRGVHLGMKRGRTSGVRLGYSQIANPLYLVRKGTVSWRHAWPIMWRNFAANLVRSLRPEPWIDRKGRLKGNCLALGDIAKGRMSPSRIIGMDSSKHE
jgi:GT2 family glycosyltransferase